MASTSSSYRPTASTYPVERNINIPCKFYPNCKFGNSCRFIHDDAVNDSPINDNNNYYSHQHQQQQQPASHASTTIAATPSFLLNSSNNLNPQAPVFVPNFYKQDFDSNNPPKSYADVVNANRDPLNTSEEIEYQQHHHDHNQNDSTTLLCPFLMKTGMCRYETCSYAHGELCEMCGKHCLDPLDSEQRKKHEKECIAAHEKEMEIAFSIQRSKEKTCGICFDIVWEKDGREQRFGILPNCNHCFCLECIRTWRQAKQFDNKIIRACPECRVCSDFVCPSSFWVSDSEEKEKLISKYKNALSEKDCKYFKKGDGTCPFGNKCFYRHCLKTGERVDVGEPARTRTINSLGQLETLQSFMFWNFLEHRVIHRANRDDIFSFSDTDSDVSDLFDFY